MPLLLPPLPSPITQKSTGHSKIVSVRACTPPLQRPQTLPTAPSTPGPGCKRPVVGKEHSMVPPSPAPDAQLPEIPAFPSFPTFQAVRSTQAEQHSVADRACLIGLPPKIKPKSTHAARHTPCKRALSRSFRFLDLPAEIRNMIYGYTHEIPVQALLVHRPRLATLRPRTRMDRSRTWASDLAGTKHDEALATQDPHPLTRNTESDVLPRVTNRPFFGLTQVCQLIRQEYLPIYMHKQEVGLDLINVDAYLKTYYPGAPDKLLELAMQEVRKADLPYSGNITIAIGDKVKRAEANIEGVEVLPLLNIWANSFRIEAGFGRYVKEFYVPFRDGEAKDLYRLFGRRVRHDRSCSAMNQIWRATLRHGCLHSVRIHRAPPNKFVDGRCLPQGPYIHIIYREEFAEPWMLSFHSEIPRAWRAARGFMAMEHYEIKVGIMPPKDAKAFVSYFGYEKEAFGLIEPSL